jgi:alanine dehydrogenase
VGPAGSVSGLPPVGEFTLRQIVKDAILECGGIFESSGATGCSNPTLNAVEVGATFYQVASFAVICQTSTAERSHCRL